VLAPLDAEYKALVEAEAVRILLRRGDLIMTETKHGFICANAGVDLSNVDRGQAEVIHAEPAMQQHVARRGDDLRRRRLIAERRLERAGQIGRGPATPLIASTPRLRRSPQ